MTTHVQPRNRILYLLLGVVGALVLLSTALVLFRSPAPPLDPASPEGTVQAYTQALLAGDNAGAIALLSPDSPTREDCSFMNLEERLAQQRITLGSTTLVPGDKSPQRATVAVMLSSGGSGGPFGGGESSFRDVFRLSQSSAGWMIDSAPWPLFACGTPPEVK